MSQLATKWVSGTVVKAVAGVAAVLLAAGGGAALGLHGQPAAARAPRHHAPPAASTTTTTTTSTTGATSSTTTPTPSVRTAVALVHYGTCSQVLGGIKAEALSEVGPYGLGNSQPEMFAGTAAGASGAPTMAAAVPAPSGSSSASNQTAGSTGSAAGQDYSGTNDQEAGVDEPDLAKTDGHLMVVLRHDPLGVQVVDVSGAAPHLDAFLALNQIDYSSELFLDGDYAVVLGASQWATPESPPGSPTPQSSTNNESGGPATDVAPNQPAGPATEAVVVSLADPHHPSVVRTFNLEGNEIGARLVGGRILVVLQDEPQLQWVSPTDSGASAQNEATSRNQALIRSSTLANWLPSVSVSPGGVSRTSSCGATLHPNVASGLDTVSVASLDPAQSQPGTEATVVGDADTVYASTDTLYVATNPWSVQMEELGPAPAPGATPPTLTTDIHAFDITNPSNPVYSGSGTVPGTLIGQYALSEYSGDLRVASTVGLPTPPPNEGTAPSQPSDNIVTVLAPLNHALVAVGSVGGLGQGEKIYGVRFEGALGYVVTFRQTDPLYVVDLSDPTRPMVEGQLGLTGYSSFLQPLSGSLLLGVGSSVDSNLRVTGLQLSVFDVSNPGDPVLRSRVELDGASSTAQDDPHALLWWPSARLVAMPVSQDGGYVDSGSQAGGGSAGNSGSQAGGGSAGNSGSQAGGGSAGNSGSQAGGGSDNNSPFNGVIVWHVGSNGTLTEVARLSQPQSPPPSPPCDTCATPQPSGPSSSASSAPASGPMVPAGGEGMYYPYPGNGIERALVVGNLLYTVSDSGVMVNSMSGWSQVAWLAFGGS